MQTLCDFIWGLTGYGNRVEQKPQQAQPLILQWEKLQNIMNCET